MGFDNECIINIQSLAGEYFCPVCRLLVYPNEALQSLCAHLFCKPCLTYVANTTRACPYDGYLVTEADCKPLVESNKPLSETLGKTAVNCLFHRSGCSWKGSLSDSTSHCSSCAFGNSPVLCNRCGVRIMHRQVQEHAQTCTGVHPQVQAGNAAMATVDLTQSVAPAAVITSAATSGKELNQQPVLSSQASVPTAEQFYQPQYQQLYQQYPGYDQYQQYYAHQQQHLPADASNAGGQVQPQPQPQPHTSVVQAPVANSHQVLHSVVPPHSQVQPVTQPSAHGQSQPLPQSYTESQLNPQYQQANPQLHIQQQQMFMQVQPHLPPSQPHLLSQAQPHGQLPPRPQSNKPLNSNIHIQPGVPQQHPVQLLSQFPQQTPLQSHATIPSQQQPPVLPPQVQAQSVPLAQQPVQQPYYQQPGETIHLRPVMRPLKQPFPQQPPLPSQLRPQGQSQMIPTQPSQDVAKSLNHVERPPMPSQGVPSQPFPQHARSLIRPVYTGVVKEIENPNIDVKHVDIDSRVAGQDKANWVSTTTKETTVKPLSKEGDLQTTLMHSSDAAIVEKKGALTEGPDNMKHLPPTVVEDTKMKDGSQQNVGKDAVSSSDKGLQGFSTAAQNHVSAAQNSTATRTPFGVEFNPSYQHGAQDLSNPQVAGVHDNKVFAQNSQVQVGGYMEPRNPIPDQGMHQPLPSHYRPPNLPPRPGAPPLGPPHQTPGLGPTDKHFGTHVPGHTFHPPSSTLDPSAASFGRGPQQSSELRHGPPQGPYNPEYSERQHVPHGREMFPNHRTNHMEGRRLDPCFPGSLEHGTLPEPPVMHPRMINRGHGDGKLAFQNERFNSFPGRPGYDVIDRAEFEGDLKQFPRPFDKGPHGSRDAILKMESRVGPIPPRNSVRHEDAFGRMEFFGPDPSFGRHYMDSFGSRNPSREHPGIYSRGYGGPSPNELHDRELRRFGDPFTEGRFSMLPNHLHRAEFEGPSRMGMDNRLRNDFGAHFRSREPDDFGAHLRHMREFGGPGRLDLFDGGDRPGFPHLGEPGFRSSYSRHGFPNDGGIFTEGFAFDKSKKRKQPSMGWCRICRVDCDTVEGLELHSQTKEHQKMAMDMVLTIKQNAKNKKLNSGNQSSLGDASESKVGGNEDHEKKN